MKYSPQIDEKCHKETGFKVSKESIQELEEKLPLLQKAWDERLPDFLEAIRRLTGKNFKIKKLDASVFICFQPSYSNPLKLWIGPYLSTYEGKVRSHDYFVRLVLHEILHTFAVENLKGKNTELWKKYSNESQITKGHLYVMAMQKAIYLKLGLQNELQIHMNHEISLGGGYARSWEIVNKLEGFQPFVNELIGDKNSKFHKPLNFLDQILAK